MILITSAAYIRPALASEFGKMPPSFLPVQSLRLYLHQIKLFPKTQKIFLSLPLSFEMDEYDEKVLSEKRIEIIKVPDNLSLGQSIIYCLNIMADYSEPLYILHGDTLFEKIDLQPDVYAISGRQDDYPWANAGKSNNDEQVYAGFFSFSSPLLLARCITECNYNFIDGINKYSKIRHVQQLEFASWKDFGLINSYYRSISKMTTERAFNSLVSTNYSITKSSLDKNKILAEAHWFKSLPTSLKHYAPTVWDEGIINDRGYYTLEYYYLSSLYNLFVFGRNSHFTWKEILAACQGFLDETFKHKAPASDGLLNNNKKLIIEKTQKRLSDYCKASGIDPQAEWVINGRAVPSLNHIVEDLNSQIDFNNPQFGTIMHGDFCFSNILYDFKSKSIKALDPRGLDVDGKESLYGDFRYDVAKLAHSIIGLYDLIIGGHFTYSENSKYDINLAFFNNEINDMVRRHFISMKFGGLSIGQLSTYPIMIQLFLSMLPLHSDRPDRQSAMLANALRLYSEYKTLSIS